MRKFLGVSALLIALSAMSCEAASAQSIPDYAGAGVSLGLESDRESANIFTHIGLTENISIRPSLNIQDEVAVDLPITYAVMLGDRVSPYIGIGPGLKFESETDLDLLATAGVDLKLTEKVIGHVNAKTSVDDTDDLALTVGIGYILP